MSLLRCPRNIQPERRFSDVKSADSLISVTGCTYVAVPRIPMRREPSRATLRALKGDMNESRWAEMCDTYAALFARGDVSYAKEWVVWGSPLDRVLRFIGNIPSTNFFADDGRGKMFVYEILTVLQHSAREYYMVMFGIEGDDWCNVMTPQIGGKVDVMVSVQSSLTGGPLALGMIDGKSSTWPRFWSLVAAMYAAETLTGRWPTGFLATYDTLMVVEIDRVGDDRITLLTTKYRTWALDDVVCFIDHVLADFIQGDEGEGGTENSGDGEEGDPIGSGAAP